MHSWRELRFRTAARRCANDEEGQVLVEYAVILALVAVLTIGVLQALGTSVSGILNRVGTALASVPNP
ncbi:MAG: Flp family type IVb pilin [Actinobacteria bacterium]|nr:MAG: Flp family type IVb pilin [Actinomycetota bacterium]